MKTDYKVDYKICCKYCNYFVKYNKCNYGRCKYKYKSPKRWPAVWQYEKECVYE